MIYHDQEIELISKRRLFGKTICQIRILATGEILDINETDLRESHKKIVPSHIRFLAIASKIKNEIARQSVLAPFESSLLPLPHQILALEKIISGSFVRFLLADEVGMGKTIEAGLVMKELGLKGIVRRVLIIVPKSAMLQWKQELKAHFNEDFHIYDTEQINTLTRTFTRLEADNEINIWKQHHRLIVSTDALRPLKSRKGWSKEKVEEYNKYRINSAIEADFDLLIIDECHKVGGASHTVSRFIMAETLCNAIPNVLLLSATPHRGKSDHFRRILKLLDADAFAGQGAPQPSELEPFVIRTEKRQAIDYDGNPLFKKRRTEKLLVFCDEQKHKKQKALYEAVTDYIKTGFNKAVTTKNVSYGFVMVLFQRMVSSSVRAVYETMKGRLQRLREEENNHDEDTFIENNVDTGFDYKTEFDYDANAFDETENRKAADTPETVILENLIRMAEDCIGTETDAKTESLLEQFDRLKRKEDDFDLKFLVFTEFIATQKMLKQVLEERGYRCEVINGKMNFDLRVNALKRFREQSQILISTDAAGESLNMQFAHIVFNYDLPWNPMVIEQRIGRVDRIGQKHEVMAYNLLLDNSIDERVYEVIEEKLDTILEQSGIDKTSDVLDSTLDNKKINHLFITSLLDPARFEEAGEEWLEEIRNKLTAYQSTESLLPSLKDEEITTDKSDDLKHSPLPHWLENLTLSYLQTKDGGVKPSLFGYHLRFPGQEWSDYTFDAKIALETPGTVHLTLQHPHISKMLAEAVIYHPDQPIPVLETAETPGVRGYWTLWHLSLKNAYESLSSVIPLFMADNNEIFMTLAEDIWSKLMDSSSSLFEIKGKISPPDTGNIFEEIREKSEICLESAYRDMEAKMMSNINRIRSNKEKALNFQEKQLNRIGIGNIRESRKRKLTVEKEHWKTAFHTDSEIIPNLECLMFVRVDNEEK